jgi:predicted 3-demethylubiquinone-9 3-methyltransferase (glyoxalase superfamily)
MFTGDLTGKAEEAMENYRTIFNNSSLVSLQRYPAHQQDARLVMYEQFRLEGQTFTAMDSGMMHGFGFTEAISLVVDCENQEEIDHYWGRLTEGGEEGNCGWLKDRYGVSWQVVPSVLGKLMTDPERAGRVTQAFMKMKKFNIQQLMDA